MIIINIIMESIERHHFSTSGKAIDFGVACLSPLHFHSGAFQSRETNEEHTLRPRGCAGESHSLETDDAGQGGIKTPLVLRFTRAVRVSR